MNMLDSIEINVKNIKDTFLELASIDAPSYGERETADVLKGKLEALGFEVTEVPPVSACSGKEAACSGKEAAQAQTFSEKNETCCNAGEYAGNIYAFLKGDLPGPPILFSAHMDTVEPSRGKKPQLVNNDMIVSDGSTVLGADDICGIVEILEAVRALKASGISHRDIEVLFTFAEEVFSRGAAVMDYSMIRSKQAYVLDMSGEVGSAANQAPTLIQFEVTVKGKSSHAGFAPENGINAIAALCSGIADIKQGRIDDQAARGVSGFQKGTLNIGTIEGGRASNIVSEHARCKGEIRSLDHETALGMLRDAEKTFNSAAEAYGASATVEHEVCIKAYETPKSSRAVMDFKLACSMLGLPGKVKSTYGGSDNNNFAQHGIEGVVLSCGVYKGHTTEEYTLVREMIKGAVLTAQLACMEDAEAEACKRKQ